jgi:Tfp pilus assembly protein PilX
LRRLLLVLLVLLVLLALLALGPRLDIAARQGIGEAEQ